MPDPTLPDGVERLEACPFAHIYHDSAGGQDPVAHRTANGLNWRVSCPLCFTSGPIVNTEEQAIEAWNRRANRDAEAGTLLADLKALLKRMDADRSMDGAGHTDYRELLRDILDEKSGKPAWETQLQGDIPCSTCGYAHPLGKHKPAAPAPVEEP